MFGSCYYYVLLSSSSITIAPTWLSWREGGERTRRLDLLGRSPKSTTRTKSSEGQVGPRAEAPPCVPLHSPRPPSKLPPSLKCRPCPAPPSLFLPRAQGQDRRVQRLREAVQCVRGSEPIPREMGGAPRNPAPRNHLLVWIGIPSGCRCTDTFGENKYRRVPTPLRSTSPFSDSQGRPCLHSVSGCQAELLSCRNSTRAPGAAVSTTVSRPLPKRIGLARQDAG